MSISKLINGGVYKNQYRTFVLVFNCNDTWSMLHLGRHVIKGMTAPMFQSGDGGVSKFTEQQLKDLYDLENWVLLDGRLRIEKIDDMSLTDYPIGEIVPMEIEDEHIKVN